MISTVSEVTDGLTQCTVLDDDRYLGQVWFEEIDEVSVEVVDYDISQDEDQPARPVRLAINHMVSCKGQRSFRAHIPIPFWQSLGFTLTESKELWYHHN